MGTGSEGANRSRGNTLGRRCRPRLPTVHLIVAVSVSASACASLRPPQTRTEQRVVDSNTIITRRAEGRPVVADVTWTNAEQFTASLQRDVVCDRTTEDTVETRRVTTRGVEGVSWATIGSSALVAAGLTGLLLAHGQNDWGSGVTPRDQAYIYSGLALGVGVPWLGHTVFMATRPEQEATRPVPIRVKRPTETDVACGTVPGRGDVVAYVDNRRIDLLSVPDSGEISVNLRQMRERLCADASDIDRTATIVFSVGKGRNDDAQLGRYRLYTCVAATTAERGIGTAETRIAKVTTARELSTVLLTLRAATDMANRLPTDDPDRPRLLARVENAWQIVAVRAPDILENDSKDAVETVSKDFEGSSARVAAIAAVAAATPAGKPWWSRVYAAFTAKAQTMRGGGFPQLVQLLQIDGATRNCLDEKVCPVWLTSEAAKDMVRPILVAGAREAQKAMRDVAAASDRLGQKLSASTIEKVAAVELTAEATLAACRHIPPHVPPLEQACEHLGTAYATEQVSVAHHRSTIDTLKHARTLAY